MTYYYLKNYKSLLLSVFLFFGLGLLITGPIYQDQEYHKFIDQRKIFEIPNFFDVTSNLFFLIVGIYGISISIKNNSSIKKLWVIFFIAICCIAPGSSYYHWQPNNETLVWDRLPMSIGFMALYIIILVEHQFKSLEKCFWPAVCFGAASVILWATTGDLRIYIWVQYSSFITIPLVLFLYSSTYTHKNFYLITLVCYFTAKIFEYYDKPFYRLTDCLISGHSLKHIIASLGIFFLVLMLKIRKNVN